MEVIVGSSAQIPLGTILQPGMKLPDGSPFDGITVLDTFFEQPCCVIRLATEVEYLDGIAQLAKVNGYSPSYVKTRTRLHPFYYAISVD